LSLRVLPQKDVAIPMINVDYGGDCHVAEFTPMKIGAPRNDIREKMEIENE
jgi:hypothetical protein